MYLPVTILVSDTEVVYFVLIHGEQGNKDRSKHKLKIRCIGKWKIGETRDGCSRWIFQKEETHFQFLFTIIILYFALV